MAKRIFRRAAVSAAALLLTMSAVAYADVINADGDNVLPSAQTMIDLGTVGAGATVTYNVYFLLECRNTAHAAPGTTIAVAPRNPSFPPGGMISGTPTTIGPVPATWPTAGQSCGTSDRFQSTTASVVTILAPMVPDTGYIYRLEYSKTPSTGVTGITTMTFRLAVSANNAPVATVPASMSVEGDTLGGWLGTYSATATDLEDGPLAAPCVPAPGALLPIGMTTVICTATDSLGATGSAYFQVTVTDTTAPALGGVPASLSVDTPEPAGTEVGWPDPSAYDLVDGPVPVTCAPASGSMFAIGSTSVECSASDSRGNVATSAFDLNLTLVDSTPPVLSGVPGDIATDTADPSGADVIWTAPTANDNVDGPIPVTCAPASGGRFPLGSTTVRCSATDAHDNTATSSFNVDVNLVDTSRPVLSGIPGNIAVDTGNPVGAVVTWPAPTANDNIDGPIPVTCAPASGGRFPVGMTSVDCSATDAHGNTATASFTVRVTLVDSSEPVISAMPADIDVATTDPTGAVVTWAAPSARDAIDGAVPVTCAPASGSRFRAGSTTVRCSASDSAGNVATRSFSVTVTVTAVPDTTPPVISGMPADIDVATTDPAGEVVTWTAPTARDAIAGSVPVTCAPASGTRFGAGTTTVRCRASDSAGNVATRSFTVTVTVTATPDTTPPTITGIPNDMAVVENPAGRMAVTWSAPSAVDNVDGPVPVTCSPVSGWSFPLGMTTVTCSASDSAGNVARGSFSVTVTPATPDPDPADELDVVWGKPIGDTDLFTTKVGKTLELKARISLDGVAVRKRAGAPRLVIERLTECGGEVVDRIDGGPLKGKARDWKAEIKTSKLGPGCYRVSVALGDAEGGDFELMILDKHGNEKKHDKHDKHDTSGHDWDQRPD